MVKETIKTKKTGSPVMDLPKEKRPYKFVLQEHIRGKSSHLDIRFEVNNHLIGFTMDDPGKVGDPLRFKNNADYSSKHKVLCQLKPRQPKDWLTVKGEIEPGGIGATKHLPAKFKILDSGTYEIGAQKSYLLEVYLEGTTYKGRFLFRKLPRKEEWEKKAGKTPFVWFAWKPINQSPYVLSSRAIEKNYVPPKGRSALNAEWEGKIPSDLKWWEKNWTGTKASLTIKEIRKSLLKRNVLLSLTSEKSSIIKPKKLQSINLSNEQIGIIARQTLNQNQLPVDIADEAKCAKTSVIYWQKKLGMR